MSFANTFIPSVEPGTPMDSKVSNARDALNVSQAFGVPLSQNSSMMANILPAAIQIEEHKKMTEVAAQYQKKYVDDFIKRYGFDEDQIKLLEKDFTTITDEVTRLIPDGDMRKMYEKYVKSYPHMYLSMIPREALQSKLAVKCVEENRNLRDQIHEMSKCVSVLVKGLSNLQMSAGVPPIVNLMFESMPDPLTSITDPMYSSYNDAITTYHALLDSTVGDKLRSDPNGAIKDALNNGVSMNNFTAKSEEEKKAFKSATTDDSLKALSTVISNMGSSSGCQPYGDEWNHNGPEPAMNPAMCMGNDAMQPGNPRHAQGRSAVYQAQRTQDGGAKWVLKGQVPVVGGPAGQVFQQPQPVYGSDPWAAFPPGGQQMAVRKSSKKSTKKGSKSKKGSKRA